MPRIALSILVALILSGYTQQSVPSVEIIASNVVVAQDLRDYPVTEERGDQLLEQSLYLLSVFVGNETGVDPQRLYDAWMSAPEANQIAIAAAVGQVGKPYRYATSDPGRGFDCSGLTAWAWEQADVYIAHQSRRQIRQSNDVTVAVAGDLAYYPGHVMMYLGVDDIVVHAANRNTGVTFGTIRRSVEFGRPG